MSGYEEVEREFSAEFSKMCRKPDGIRYLKVRTLIDSDALKYSSSLLEFLSKLNIRVSAVNRNEIQRIRRELYRLVSQGTELDHATRRAYLDLYGQVNYDRLMQNLKLVAIKGDEYWRGWNSVYRDDVRDHIQHHFVRQRSIQDLKTLLQKIDTELPPVLKGYIVISWYNQWTNEVIERFFKQNSNVVPTVRRINKVDFFFRDIPIDLKVTFLPDQYIKQVKREHRTNSDKFVIDQVKHEPLDLARWLYENQGKARFSDSNRLFLVLIDENNLADSWKLKVNFEVIQNKAESYLTNTASLPEINWNFGGDSFETYSDVILVTCDSKPS